MEDAAKLNEDIALLSTPYVPGVQDVSVIKARLQAQRDEITALVDRISGSEKGSEELRARCSVLMKHYKVGRALLAPIRRLPVEILEEVFANSLPTYYLDDLETDNSNSPWHPDEPHPHVVRTELRRVCRRWRNVIEDAPRLWSTLSLDYLLSEDIDEVGTLLAKSGTCLLDIFIRPESWFNDRDEDRQRAIFNLLRREVSRLRFFMADVLDEDDMFNIFPADRQTEALRMEVFGLIRSDDPEEEEDRWTGTIHSPSLKHLILRNAEFQLNSFTSLPDLRRLTTSVNISASNSYLPFLQGCPKLEFLHWADYSSGKVGLRRMDVNLPALKGMVYYTDVAEDSPDFLGNIRAAALESLVVDASCASCDIPPIQEVLGSFVREDVPSLLSLAVWHASFRGPGIAQLLNRLSNVQSIRMVSCKLDPTFFTALATGDGTSPPACPKLASITFEWTDLPVEDLVHFIHMRARSDIEERSPGRVYSVVISHCTDKNVDSVQQHILQLRQTHSDTVTFIG